MAPACDNAALPGRPSYPYEEGFTDKHRNLGYEGVDQHLIATRQVLSRRFCQWGQYERVKLPSPCTAT